MRILIREDLSQSSLLINKAAHYKTAQPPESCYLIIRNFVFWQGDETSTDTRPYFVVVFTRNATLTAVGYMYIEVRISALI